MRRRGILCSTANGKEVGKRGRQKPQVTDITPQADCPKVEYRPGDVYGPYVPYTGPPLLCHTPNPLATQGSTSQPNSSAVHPEVSQPVTNSVAQPSLDLNGLDGASHFPATNLLTTDSKPSEAEPAAGVAYVRP